MLRGDGKRDAEIQLATKARGQSAKLEDACQPAGPPLEQIRRALAYLLGDLGHGLQLVEKLTEARAAFAEAVTYWEKLLKSHPASEEYAEGNAWCHQRLKELK